MFFLDFVVNWLKILPNGLKHKLINKSIILDLQVYCEHSYKNKNLLFVPRNIKGLFLALTVSISIQNSYQYTCTLYEHKLAPAWISSGDVYILSCQHTRKDSLQTNWLILIVWTFALTGNYFSWSVFFTVCMYVFKSYSQRSRENLLHVSIACAR